MKPRGFFSLLLLAPLASTVHAGVTGKCSYEGKPLAFVDTYAALAPDPFEETKKVPMLWFTTNKLDHAALAAVQPDEIDDALDAQVFENGGAKLELRLDGAGKLVEGVQLYIPPGTSRSVSSNEVGSLQLKTAMATRATGRWVLTDDDDLQCDLSFDVAIAGKGPPPPPPKPWGTALPKGGGEPGKVYMAMHRAALAGDADAMMKLATRARAEEMRKARSQPEFPQMLEMIKAFEPAQVSVVSGQANARRAELKIAGKETDGASMTGDVKLVFEDGAWKIEKVNTRSKLN